jgi:DNA primase
MLRLDLEAVRARNPIPTIAGAIMKLRPAGREWTGCCPFHSDRSPSFTVFNGGRRFHCFGCGAAGDVIDFVARAHGVGFREAVAMLGDGGLLSESIQFAPATFAKDMARRRGSGWNAR